LQVVSRSIKVGRMDVRLTDEQSLLQASARELLEAECPMKLVRAVVEHPTTSTAVLWSKLAELGWLGLLVPESLGGAGLGFVDLALVLEEAGRALLPGPFLSTILAADLVSREAERSVAARLLPRLLRGDLRVALAVLEPHGSWRPADVALAARTDAQGWRLTGTKTFVADAPSTDALIVPALTAEGIALFFVDTRSEGLSLRPHAYLDETHKMATVRFESVRVSPEDRIVASARGAVALAELLSRARAGLAAELCGLAARVLELSVAYARTREQFGRPIGSFQAIQHRCADMLVKVESARSAVWYAAWAIDAGVEQAELAANLAKAYASECATRVAGDGIQIHGGLGFTWEQDLHFYYKRAVASELAYGDPASCYERAAELAIDGDSVGIR
jgi:alkylation response protein AidB-like acyl-CoA dehydrogenase